MTTSTDNTGNRAPGRLRDSRHSGDSDHPVNILLVDSDTRNLDALEAALESRECALIRAATADDALRAIALQDFALLILNLRMPSVSGLELAQIIRDRGRTWQLPIIFLSPHYPEDEDALQAFDSGSVDYLPMPFNATVLRSKAQVFVELYRKRRALLCEIGARIRTNRQLAERETEVQQLVHQLRALTLELNRAAQRERQQLAKVLHDHMQQFLVSAKMQLSAVERDIGSARCRKKLRSVEEAIEEAIALSRTVTAELSPPILEQERFADALEWLARQMKKAHRFTVRVHAGGAAEPISEAQRLLLFECVRELLLNAIKHSGVAEADLELAVTQDGCTRIVVEDHGDGFDAGRLQPEGNGRTSFGLFSIQQRLAHFGGELEIESARGRGTRVVILLPREGPARVSEHGRPVPLTRLGMLRQRPRGKRIGQAAIRK